MNYELAKELKNAGFPQIRVNSISKEVNPFSLIYPKGQKWFDGFPIRPTDKERENAGILDDAIHIDDYDKKVEVGAYLPTLSELIEACTGINILKRTGLSGESSWSVDTLDYPEVYGSTPEEALVRLWLALNSSNDT